MKKGGILHFLGSLLWILIVLGVILAVARKMNIGSIDSFLEAVKSKALYYAECIPSRTCGLLAIVDDIDPESIITGGNNDPSDKNEDENSDTENNLISRETKGYRGPGKREPYVTDVGLVTKKQSLEIIETLTVMESENKDFNIEEWKHWVKLDENKPCWNTKEEIISRDAVPNSVSYLNQYLEKSEVDQACTVGQVHIEDNLRIIKTENSGEWICPYTGKEITDVSELIVDHIVPLSYANNYGGNDWDEEEKQIFANDVDNLLSISKEARGKREVEEYLPNPLYKCQYAKSFVNILNKYNLGINDEFKNLLTKTIKMCQY